MKDTQTILKSIDALPPFPQIARKALAVLSDPDYSAPEVVRLIELDPSITAEVLRLCNSSYFGLVRKVGSVRQAVAVLGQKSLIQLIMTSSSLRFFKRDSDGYEVKGVELWRHSVACAIMCHILLSRVGLTLEHDVFTTGLLHDIGKMVLSRFVKEELGKIRHLVEEDNYSFLEAEKEVLGMDHAELGAAVVERWNFPEEICRAIRFHHTPQKALPDDLLTHVVYLANITCLLAGEGGSGVDGLRYRGHSEAILRLNLKAKDIQSNLILLEEEMRKTEELIRLG